MKTLYGKLMLAIAIFVCFSAHAQKTKMEPINRFMIHGRATYRGAYFGAELQIKNRWLYYFNRTAEKYPLTNEPIGYDPGYERTKDGAASQLRAPKESFKTTTLGMGRVLTAPSKKGWVAAKAGISMVNYKNFEFAQIPRDSIVEYTYFLIIPLPLVYYTPSHSYKAISEKGIGLHLAVDGEFLLTSWLGVGGGVEAILSGPKSRLTYNLGFSIGYMRPGKSKKDPAAL